MAGIRESINDMYGCVLMVDLARFKEGLENERQARIAKRAESIQYFLSK